MPLRSSGYQLLEKLGEGVTAVVYLAKCHTTQSKVAVKLVDLQAMEAVGGLVRPRQGTDS
jgi:serine/threonine protein kinase